MSNESSQPSTPLNSAVDLSVVRVLRVLDPIARSSKCEYFLAGATARDLILVNVHGLLPGRATRDIDFGIAVESWAQFELLKERLLATNDFSASRAQQRLTFTDSNEGISIPVDLIPFRGVASADGTIAWPPGRDIVMNVAGFEEALTSSVLIEIEANLTVHVASVAGLTLLKLAAWVDRGRESNKDAADLSRATWRSSAACTFRKTFGYPKPRSSTRCSWTSVTAPRHASACLFGRRRAANG